VTAHVRSPLTELAVQNEPLIRLLADPAKPAGSIAAFARAVGRDKSNVAKSLDKLVVAGLAATPNGRHVPDLTDAGRQQLEALDRAAGVAPPAAGGGLQLAHALIRPNPLNPRKHFDPVRLEQLADTIESAGDILENLVVTPPGPDGLYTLYDGERRWRAVGLLIERGTWPADRGLPCKERAADAKEVAALSAYLALVANGQAEPLTDIEEARAYAVLIQETGWSASEAARRAGKNPRVVQEAIKVIREAKPADIKLHEDHNGAAPYTWEWLRHSVRNPGEAPSPPPAAETPATATALVLDPARPAPPTEAELTPAQALIMAEIDAAVRTKPELKAPLGPTTKIRQFSTPDKDPDVQRLISEGFIQLDLRGAPSPTVSLLRPGALWLARQPGNFMDIEYRLLRARQEAEVPRETHDELVASGEYDTGWLNIPPPPKPYEVSDPHALVLLEILDATQKLAAGLQYRGAEVRNDFDRPLAEELKNTGPGLIYGLHSPAYEDGIWRFKTSYDADKSLEAQFPGSTKTAATRRQHIAALRAKLGAPNSTGYVTSWLNGPFEPDGAWAAERQRQREARERVEAERQAEASRKAAEAEAAIAIGVQFLEQAQAIRAEVAAVGGDLGVVKPSRFVVAANLGGAPLPWSLDAQGDIIDRDGNPLIAHKGAPLAARRLLMVLCLNAAAGYPTPDIPAVAGDLDEPEFVRAMAAAMLDEEPAASRAAAERAAARFLAGHLQDEGVAYGAPGLSWTAEAAAQLVEEFDVFAFFDDETADAAEAEDDPALEAALSDEEG
jgi:ParB/RepB/Spo0J family partition protein